jgi:hypothetical protein
MNAKRIFLFVVLGLAIGFLGCAKGQKVEAPKQEQVTKNLVPLKVDLKGENFSLELSDLSVAMTVDTGSKEIVDTPSLTGHVKITNLSKDILDLQAVTLEYLDEAGKPIPFKSGEKIARASLFLKAIKPGEDFDGSLDVTIPRAAVKEKALSKVEVNVVYVPSPLKREVLTMSEKLE